MGSIPRPEYPRPQMVRNNWMNLNGEWQFEIDQGCSGEARGLVEAECLSGRITVPFCPESRLSGVNNRDFMYCVWYKRTFDLPETAENKKVLLHFGAADYRTKVWINGIFAGLHEGGYVSFTMDISAAVKNGCNTVTVCCEDNVRDPMQPNGKQSRLYHSHDCDYTRTTGIWHTVWIEWVEPVYVKQIFITPDAANASVHFRAIAEEAQDALLKVDTYYNGTYTGSAAARMNTGSGELTVNLLQKHLWDIGKPKLYEYRMTLSKDDMCDEVSGYFGLRSVGFDGMHFLLNGRPVFQRLILDQGFYPDGVYTAPSDDDLKNDIILSMKMGFNGARLHQKVFEQRFLYWADHLGYLCWGEMASWGLDHSQPGALAAFSKEWLEELERDYNAPCIIGWCPFNETWDYEGRRQNDDVLRMVYRITKAVDKTRPCIDTSGNYHVETDIFDVHDYEQDVNEWEKRYGKGTEPIYDRFSDRQRRKPGQPVFVSEYGGIRWTDQTGWGYGKGPESEEEFIERFRGLTDVLLDNPDHCGLCYTQLTDVEQEQNGLLTFDRKPKLPPETIREIMSRKAACEE
ncbi:MAG: beta-galactosidase [Clostridiales bacterium]|nr:beta-galactosidase [Clostridiales bacterium]